MRNYELVCILSVNLEEDKQKKLISQIKTIIEGLKGKVEKTEAWGKRDLSYPIQKQTQGVYVEFNFSGDEKSINQLEAKLKSENHILRHLLIKVAP